MGEHKVRPYGGCGNQQSASADFLLDLTGLQDLSGLFSRPPKHGWTVVQPEQSPHAWARWSPVSP